MPVVVLAREDRDDDTTGVTLSQDGVRFTVIVPTLVDRDSMALNIYQIMADRMVKTIVSLRNLTKPGGEL